MAEERGRSSNNSSSRRAPELRLSASRVGGGLQEQDAPASPSAHPAAVPPESDDLFSLELEPVRLHASGAGGYGQEEEEEELELELELEADPELGRHAHDQDVGRGRRLSEEDGPDHRMPPRARGVRAAAEQAAAAMASPPVPLWRRPLVQGSVALLLLLLLLLLVADWLSGGSTPGTPHPDVPLRHLQLVQSPLDPRSYRFVQLVANSLPVLLVHDAAADSAAASMSVGTGSSSDPPERQGLAHFLEHALFLGSEQFPDEHGYAAFLAAHGGGSNAYTSDGETNFFFSVQHDALAGVLPMFAGFFTLPLLRPGALQREMRAVDAEHAKNRLDDEWRQAQLLRSLSSPKSSFNHFGTGRIESLNSTSVGQELRDFYQKHYRASNMRLVLLGRESLPELEQLAVELFSAVPGPPLHRPASVVMCKETDTGEYVGGMPDGSEQVEPQTTERGGAEHRPVQLERMCVHEQVGYISPLDARPFDTPFDPLLAPPFDPFSAGSDSALGSISRNVSVVPMTSPSHSLSLYFPLPSSKAPLASRFTQDAAGFLSYIIGHEGSDKTLCSALKKLGLASSVQVGTVWDSPTSDRLGGGGVDQVLLGVEVTLTEEGDEWEGRERVVKAVFHYLELVREAMDAAGEDKSELSVLAQQYTSMSSEASLRFRFAEPLPPISAASTLSSRMSDLLPLGLPVQHLLLPPSSVHNFGDGGEIRRALDHLTRDNVMIVWSSSRLQSQAARDEVAPAAEWGTEEWYGTLYHVTALDESFRQGDGADSSDPDVELELPPSSNPFLPPSFEVLDVKGMIQAALVEEEKAGSTDESRPAAGALRHVIGNFNATADVPVSLPLFESEGGALPSTHRLYFSPDAVGFGLPYAYYSTLLRFPPGFLLDADAGPRRVVQLQLWQLVLADALQADQYELGQVNMRLGWEVHPARLGFTIHLVGFGSNLLQVWGSLLPRIFQAVQEVSAQRLGQLRAELLRSYASYPSSMQPYQHALDFQRVWEERSRRTVGELGAILLEGDGTGSPEELAQFVEEAFSSTSMASLAYGNCNISLAQLMHAETLRVLQSLPTPLATSELSQQQLEDIRSLGREEFFQFAPSEDAEGAAGAGASSVIFRHPVLNAEELNSALVLNFQIAPLPSLSSPNAPSARDAQLRSDVLLQLLAQLLSESAFNVLRTRWSLGYMVWGQVRESAQAHAAIANDGGANGGKSFVFIIQNPRLSPRALEARVEEFLLLFQTEVVHELTPDDVAQQKSTLRESLRQSRAATLSMSVHHAHAWGRVARNPDAPDFERETDLMRALEGITLEDIRSFYESQFLQVATRRKSSMLLYGAAHAYNASSSPQEADETDHAVVQEQSDAIRAILEYDRALGPVQQRDAQRIAEQWSTWT